MSQAKGQLRSQVAFCLGVITSLIAYGIARMGHTSRLQTVDENTACRLGSVRTLAGSRAQ